jgi:outer membrane protein OmpA-like peptidoglycan-associated protein
MKKIHLVMVLGLLACAPFFALAEEETAGEGLDLNHMLCRHQGPTATGETGLFTLRSGYTLCKGQWAFGTYYNNWARRTTGIPGRDPLWNDWDLDHDQLSVGVGYGLTDKLEVAFSIPYHWYDAEGNDGVGSGGGQLLQGGLLNGRSFLGRIDQSGLGDLRVAAKLQLSESENRGLALNAFIDVPTGDDDEAVVTGELGFGLGLNWSASNWIFNLGYSDPGDPDNGFDVSAQVDLGVGYARSVNERLEWITELVSAVKTESDAHSDTDITSGFRYHFGEGGDWAFNAGLRVDLSDDDIWDNYNPVGGLIGLTYSPRRSYDLALSTAGECSGHIESNPVGAHCGGAGRAFGCSQSVALTAVPDDCCEFESWSGDCAGSDADTSVTLDGHKSCTASFKKKVYRLSVEKTTMGSCGASGGVTSEPDGIECGSACSAEFVCGETVNLLASPKKGVTLFANWDGDCSGTDPQAEITMDGDKACIAKFKCDDCYEDQEVEVSRAACYFEVNKTKLDNRCKQQLDEVGLAMKDYSDFTVAVTGHSCCDRKASDEYLQKISEERATAAQEYLMERHGIDASRFATSGMGCEEAKASDDPNHSEHKRADVIFVVKKRVKVPCQP